MFRTMNFHTKNTRVISHVEIPKFDEQGKRFFNGPSAGYMFHVLRPHIHFKSCCFRTTRSPHHNHINRTCNKDRQIRINIFQTDRSQTVQDHHHTQTIVTSLTINSLGSEIVGKHHCCIIQSLLQNTGIQFIAAAHSTYYFWLCYCIVSSIVKWYTRNTERNKLFS